MESLEEWNNRNILLDGFHMGHRKILLKYPIVNSKFKNFNVITRYN